MPRADARDEPLTHVVPHLASAVPVSAGMLVAGRYRLQRPLGHGGEAEVWLATDVLTRTRVALKLLHPTRGASEAHAQREIRALRLLRLPGVVRMLDGGLDDGRAFVAMERVNGAPFPGARGARTWRALAPRAFALLEVVARVHAAGVLHRDLKPSNVRVDARGAVTLLDFGVAHVESMRIAAGRDSSELVGTLDYLAPELLTGGVATPRSDLYAIGVMLYEALAGRRPYAAARDVASLRAARPDREPVSLARRCPGLPRHVAATIDALLSRDPDRRPASAVDALQSFGRRGVETRWRLPWLGSTDAIHRIADALDRGRTVDVLGAEGSGRSRMLDEVATVLRDRGRHVVRMNGRDPGPVRWRRRADGRATVLLVDDADALDTATRARMTPARGVGAVAFARRTPPVRRLAADETVTLAPLDEDALRTLFAGPDRILHLREDGARQLHGRTGGVPGAIVDEVRAWIDARLCRWHQQLLRIDREAIARLESGAWRPLASMTRAPVTPLPEALDTLLAWIALAGPTASTRVLGRAMRRTPSRLDAQVRALVKHGALVQRADGLFAQWVSRTGAAWTAAQRRAAHRALADALPGATVGRLWHLAAGSESGGPQDAQRVVEEALALAGRMASDGDLEGATTALEDALDVVRSYRVEARDEEALLALVAEVALAAFRPGAVDRALYEVCRARYPSKGIGAIEKLLRAALAVQGWARDSLQLVDALSPFVDRRLERCRQLLRLTAARRNSRSATDRVLADAARWVAESGDESLDAHLASWQGQVRYHQGRYALAARLHDRAADRHPGRAGRIAAMINAGSALLESFDSDAATARALLATREARACRHLLLEARAEWLRRCVAYRIGCASSIDLEFVELCSRLTPDLEALACMCEAAIAWRSGDLGDAHRLARRATRLWRNASGAPGSLLARALEIATTTTPSARGVRAVEQESIASDVPGLAIQVVALTRGGNRSGRTVDVAMIDRLTRTVPISAWSCRMDVMSVEEALTLLAIPQSPMPACVTDPVVIPVHRRANGRYRPGPCTSPGRACTSGIGSPSR